jgi:putative MFS transporter
MLILFNIFQTVGFYGFANWVPTLLIEKGITITHSLQYTFIIAIASPLSPLICTLFADKFERKWQIVIAAAGVGLTGLVFAAMSAPTLIIVLGVLLTFFSNMMSFAFHAYQPELYPTRIRAVAVGFVYSWSRLSVVLMAFVIAWTLREFGVPGVFTLIAGSMVIVVLAIAILGPKTLDRPLESISH